MYASSLASATSSSLLQTHRGVHPVHLGLMQDGGTHQNYVELVKGETKRNEGIVGQYLYRLFQGNGIGQGAAL
jgi:hypothetical protein